MGPMMLNKSKCEFNKHSIEFFGQTFSSDGVSPSPAKGETLKHTEVSKSKKEVCSLLGLATYYVPFIPSLTTISEPLQKLMKDKTLWEWGKVQKSAVSDQGCNHTSHHNVILQPWSSPGRSGWCELTGTVCNAKTTQWQRRKVVPGCYSKSLTDNSRTEVFSHRTKSLCHDVGLASFSLISIRQWIHCQCHHRS